MLVYKTNLDESVRFGSTKMQRNKNLYYWVPKSTTLNAFTGELNSRRPFEQNSANHILTYVAIGQFQYRDLQILQSASLSSVNAILKSKTESFGYVWRDI